MGLLFNGYFPRLFQFRICDPWFWYKTCHGHKCMANFEIMGVMYAIENNQVIIWFVNCSQKAAMTPCYYINLTQIAQIVWIKRYAWNMFYELDSSKLQINIWCANTRLHCVYVCMYMCMCAWFKVYIWTCVLCKCMYIPNILLVQTYCVYMYMNEWI